MENNLLFLGTGASSGIPIIGCSCPVCRSSDPRDRRLRTSALLQINGKTLLIDASPDIRYQALHHQITHIDGLILTHTHYDHVGGLEELRIYNFIQGHALDCLLTKSSFKEVQQLFAYLFTQKAEKQNNTSKFNFIPLETDIGEVLFQEIPIRYLCYYQGEMKVMGIRVGNFAYLTDIKDYTDEIFTFLEGVTTLVISALRFTPSLLHLTIDDAIDFIGKSGAKKGYFIHMSHEVLHAHAESVLPDGIHFAYDGLRIFF